MYVQWWDKQSLARRRTLMCCFVLWKVAMENDAEVVEHWTITGQRVVLTGNESAISSIVRQLELPHDASIRLASGCAAVALWGESLSTYLQRKTRDSVYASVQPATASQKDVLISASIA